MDIYAAIIQYLKLEKGYTVEKLNSFSNMKLGVLVRELAPSFPTKLRVEFYMSVRTNREKTEIDTEKLGTALKKALSIICSYKYKGKSLRTPSWEKWCQYGRTSEDLWNLLHSEQYYSLTDNARVCLRSNITAMDVAYIIDKITVDMTSEKKFFYLDWIMSSSSLCLLDVELVYIVMPKLLFLLKSCLSDPDIRVSEDRLSNVIYHFRAFVATVINVDFCTFRNLSLRISNKLVEFMDILGDDRLYLRDIAIPSPVPEEVVITRQLLNYIRYSPSWAPMAHYEELLETYRVFGFNWKSGYKGRDDSGVDRRYLWSVP